MAAAGTQIEVNSAQGRREAVQKLLELQRERPASPHVQTLLDRRDKLTREISQIDRDLRNAKQATEADERARQEEICSLRRMLEESAGPGLDAVIGSLERDLQSERLRPGPFPPGLADAITRRVEQLRGLIAEAIEAKATAVDPEVTAGTLWAKLPPPARAAAS
jgi:hypothetical protein